MKFRYWNRLHYIYDHPRNYELNEYWYRRWRDTGTLDYVEQSNYESICRNLTLMWKCRRIFMSYYHAAIKEDFKNL